MTRISLTAKAGQDILRRIQLGELEIHGILLRDTATKKFRYILRGLDGITDATRDVPRSPSLQALQNILSLSNILSAIEVARNLSSSASLRSIEAKLDKIATKLESIEKHIIAIGHNTDLGLAAIRSNAVARLKAAKTAAIVAQRSSDLVNLKASAKDCEQSAHDLLAYAGHLVRREEHGIPLALQLPDDLAGLIESGADAMAAASTIYSSLGEEAIAARLMHEVADEAAKMRAALARALTDPELAMRRLMVTLAEDSAIADAGVRLRNEQYWTRARAIELENGQLAQLAQRTNHSPSTEQTIVGFEAIGELG